MRSRSTKRRFESSAAGITVHPTLGRPRLEPDDEPPEGPPPTLVPRCTDCKTWLITLRSQVRKRCLPCLVVRRLQAEARKAAKQPDLVQHLDAVRLLDAIPRTRKRFDRDRPDPEPWLD